MPGAASVSGGMPYGATDESGAVAVESKVGIRRGVTLDGTGVLLH